jgi:phosphate transport system substrate-binding protein
MHAPIHRTLVGCLVLLLFLSACGPSTAESPAAPQGAGSAGDTADMSGTVDPATVTGAIEITGSSTVFPLTSAVAAAFTEEGSPANISIRGTGTGAGFEVFCGPDSDVDIVNASRSITDEEQAACTAEGHPAISFRVGTDALAVVVNETNDFVTDLSLEQLAQIFSGTATTWSEVDPAYPAEPITLFSPGIDSGTFDYFIDEVFDGDEEPILNTPGVLLSEDDYELVQGIADDPYAIGYFGFAYYQDNQERLNVVAIDPGTGEAISPMEETVSDGSYPLARPLFIYSSSNIMQAQPQVAAFIDYYLVHVPEFIEEVGYFPISPDTLEESRQKFRDAMQETAGQ